MDSLKKRWKEIESHSTIPLNEFLNGVSIVLNSTYFKFNDTVYKQIFGTPMGSPLSPIIAEIVMRDLEKKALANLSFEIPIYFRYVDDIIIATPSDKLEEALEMFNSQYNRIWIKSNSQ